MINDLEKRHETEITKLCFVSSMIAILPRSKLPSLYRSFASTLTPTSLMRLQHYVSGNVFSITPPQCHIFQIPAYLWLWNRTKTVVCDKVMHILWYSIIASYRLLNTAESGIYWSFFLYTKLEKQIEEKISDMCKGSNSECTIVFIFAPISEEFHSAYHTESRG